MQYGNAVVASELCGKPCHLVVAPAPTPAPTCGYGHYHRGLRNQRDKIAAEQPGQPKPAAEFVRYDELLCHAAVRKHRTVAIIVQPAGPAAYTELMLGDERHAADVAPETTEGLEGRAAPFAQSHGRRSGSAARDAVLGEHHVD